MKKGTYSVTVDLCREIKPDSGIFLISFIWPNHPQINPGQFIVLEALNQGSVMPRPFSVYKTEKDKISILVQVVGPNTDAYSRLRRHDQIKISGPRGKPITIDPQAKNYILVGGGIGVAALTLLAKKLRGFDKKVKVLLGAKTSSQIVAQSIFKKYGCQVKTITEKGEKTTGFVTELLKKELRNGYGKAIVISCGPKLMLKKVAEITAKSNKCWVVLEEMMACGIGSCKGCGVFGNNKNGEEVKHVCTDGPAFDACWINWDKLIPTSAKITGPKEKPKLITMENTLVGQNKKTLTLDYPIMNASGCLAIGSVEQKIDISRMGALITKAVTLLPRLGNPMPRVCETASGMLNSIGLENVGLKIFKAEELPRWLQLGKPIIVNISGFAIEEFGKIATELADTKIAAIEVNVSCPNVEKGGMSFGIEPQSTYEVTKTVCQSAPNKFIIVKLPPAVSDIVAVGKAATRAGADALSVINTIPGIGVDIYTRSPKLGNIIGGLSGPAIKPVGLYIVYRLYMAELGIPIIGIGGIDNSEDAIEYLITDASAIGVGTGLFPNPLIFTELYEGIKMFMKKEGINHIKNLIGSLKIK